MIVRTWRTGVRDGRVEDYRRFARERSLPMFRQQDGCLGVVFAEGPDDYLVISYWRDEEAVEQLGDSVTYQSTVRALLDSGILTGPQRVEVFSAEIGFLDVN